MQDTTKVDEKWARKKQAALQRNSETIAILEEGSRSHRQGQQDKVTQSIAIMTSHPTFDNVVVDGKVMKDTVVHNLSTGSFMATWLVEVHWTCCRAWLVGKKLCHLNKESIPQKAIPKTMIRRNTRQFGMVLRKK